VAVALAYGSAGPSVDAEQPSLDPVFEVLGSSRDAPSDFVGSDVADRFVVSVEGEPALAAVRHRLARAGVEPDDVWSGALNGFSAQLDAAQLAELRARGDVVAVEPARRFEATQTNAPWGLDRIDQRSLPLDGTYSPTGTGAGVTAYVIDSGLWASHVEFAGRVPRGVYWDFGDGSNGWDCDGHGTHVAGTLGGATYGVAKQVQIVPVKVLDCDGGGPMEALLEGINWVIGDHAAGVPAVANISVGGPASGIVDSAVQAMIDDGITVVVAAGNDAAPSCNFTPARLGAAITVAASEIDDDDADFSNYGACNDIFAPGSGILSADTFSDTASAVHSGTSMASPFVAGAAALVLQAQPGLSPAEVWAALDAASTKGAISECCGDPDKLLYVTPTQAPPVGTFVAMSPVRFLDSRSSIGMRGPGSVTVLPVAGLGGVPGDAAAVALNVTVTEPAEPGFVTVYPCGADRPTASNLNFAFGQTIPNAVIATVGSGGAVCLFASAATHLVVDVNGWFPPSAGFGPLSPVRLLDTRVGLGVPAGLRPATSVTPLLVAGLGGVPGSAAAVALNVTVTEPGEAGFVTVFPCDASLPMASNLNFAAGQTIPNAVIAKLSGDGRVCLYSSAPTHLVVDVDGWFPPGSGFGALTPARLLDTREGPGLRDFGAVTEVTVAGQGGVPGGASAVALNVTVTDTYAPGFVTVFPCGSSPPTASNLNFAAGQTIPNAVLAKVGAGGQVCLYNSAPTHLVVDVNGWFA
jgi:hypothetical protein